MKKESKDSYLLNQPKYDSIEGRSQLLRIELNPDFTKIDFGYQTTSYYVKGGWVRIDAKTFIRIHSTDERLTLINAINIPIAPEQHYFDTSKDWLYFSLIFSTLKVQDCTIDVIEQEDGNEDDLNFYNIEINKKDLIQIKKKFH